MDSAGLPDKLKQAAILQLVSGSVNVLVMSAGVAMTLSVVSGAAGLACGTLVAVLTGCPLAGVGGATWLCGLWGLVLLPIGLLEIVSGLVVLVQPESSATVVRAAAMAEVVSLVFGGLVSAIVGTVVLRLLRDPEVVGFLDAEIA